MRSTRTKDLIQKSKANYISSPSSLRKIEKNNLKLFKLRSSLNIETVKPQDSTKATKTNEDTTEAEIEIDHISRNNLQL